MFKVPRDDEPQKGLPSWTSDKGRLCRGFSAVFGAFLIHLTLGNFFTLGNLSPYIISYIRHKVDPTVDNSYAIWINAMSYAGQGSLMVVGGLLDRKIGTRFTCLIGCTIFCGCIALSSWIIKFGFIALALTYGLATCIGLGIAYIAALALGMRWFPQRKGLVNGTILAGYGLGALVFNPVQTTLVNPKNRHIDEDHYFSDPEVLEAVPHLFLYMGAIYGAIQLVSICLLFPVNKEVQKSQVYLINVNNPSVNTLDENGEIENGAMEKRDSLRSETVPSPDVKSPLDKVLREINTRAMFRHKEFYMLWFTFALHCQCIQFVNTYYKTYGETMIHDDHFLSTVGSIAGIFNCFGRIFWGMLQDRTSYKLCMLILSACFALFMFTFCLVHFGGRAMFAIWVLATFFVFSGIFSLLPTATSQAFGLKNAGTNFGIVFTAPAIMAIGGAPLIQYLLRHIDWTGTFCTLASLNVIAFIITIFVPRDMESVRRNS